MFLAGIVPGVIMGLSMMVWNVIAVKKLHVKAPTVEKSSWRERFIYTVKALPALGGPMILIGGIMTGIFTPTECSVVAAAYCVMISIFYKKFSIEMLTRALRNTLSSAAMCMALCATGLIFNWMIVTSGLMSYMAQLMLSLGNKYLVLLLLNAILLVMGCFIGSMQVLIMIAPLLMDLASALGLSLGILAL